MFDTSRFCNRDVTIYLLNGYLDYVATSLADAQALLAALDDPGDLDNVAIIDRVTGRVKPVVQSDTGEPLVISSIDDTAGTISSWITDADTTVALGLGAPDASQSFLYASTSGLTISGNTRVGTLALNTAELQRAIGLGRPYTPFSVQIRKTTGGVTETMGLISVHVMPGVL